MTLYSGPLSMFGAKAHIAALEKGFAINLVMVPFSNDLGYEPKHPEVLRINSKRQVPYRSGYIPSEICQPHEASTIDMLGYPGMQAAWELRKSYFQKSFRTMMDEKVAAAYREGAA
jgi:hypothetical protein